MLNWILLRKVFCSRKAQVAAYFTWSTVSKEALRQEDMSSLRPLKRVNPLTTLAFPTFVLFFVIEGDSCVILWRYLFPFCHADRWIPACFIADKSPTCDSVSCSISVFSSLFLLCHLSRVSCLMTSPFFIFYPHLFSSIGSISCPLYLRYSCSHDCTDLFIGCRCGT